MGLDLRGKSVRILRRLCGSQAILPCSCMLSDNTSKEGDITFADSGVFGDVWKGHNNGNRVCVRVFRVFAPENMFRIKWVCTP